MKLFRLDSVAPIVAERFRVASSTKRREATAVACEHAVVCANLIAPEVNQALAVLRGTAAPDDRLRHQLEILAARLDDEYFQTSETDGVTLPQDAVRLFSKARAASALAFSLASDAELHEALYEAIAAFDDPHELMHLIERILGASSE